MIEFALACIGGVVLASVLLIATLILVASLLPGPDRDPDFDPFLVDPGAAAEQFLTDYNAEHDGN